MAKRPRFVSGFKTNPVDAAFLNGHMIRAMDYNDIYWKADPCHPSDIIAAPLALCESEGLSGKDLILATIIAYEIEMRLCEVGRPGVREYGWHHATLSAFAAPIAAGRVSQSHRRSDGVGDRHQRGAHVLSRRGDGRQADQHEEHGRSMGGTHGCGKRAARARRILRAGAHDRWQGRTLRRVQPRAVQGRARYFRWRALVADLPNSRRSTTGSSTAA